MLHRVLNATITVLGVGATQMLRLSCSTRLRVSARLLHKEDIVHRGKRLKIKKTPTWNKYFGLNEQLHFFFKNTV